MPKIILRSPVGAEPSTTNSLVPLADPRGNKVAFLFNGHVSVVPFWRHLEEELKLRCEPESTTTVVKPNTFAPASDDNIQELSNADLALVGVCA
ncbi:MAG: hypothetical protein BZY81_04610 [SAR202 cluster bacterium Io17-Chloro-G4]|nr:MAG: hypothetical protein BZY81_04610 [SAR202 cluster bacterium Io17-Chloro-G4]